MLEIPLPIVATLALFSLARESESVTQMEPGMERHPNAEVCNFMYKMLTVMYVRSINVHVYSSLYMI